MSKWQKISIVLAGLLVLSCLALAGVSTLWLTHAGGSSVLAAMMGKTPTPTMTVEPQAPLVMPRPNAGTGNLPIAGTFGTVSAINGTAVTVAGAKGNSQTLALGAQTRVIVVGTPNASVSDVKVNDRILALGVKRGANSLEPRAILVAPAGYNQSNIQMGQVQAVSGQTLTLLVRNNPVTVDLDSSTQILAQNLQTLKPPSLANTNGVVVIGQPNGDGTFSAQLILARVAPKNVSGGATPAPSPSPTTTQ